MNAALTLELARLAELESCVTPDLEHAKYLESAGSRLRESLAARATARLTKHLSNGGLARVSIGHYSDTVGPHADATATAPRFATVAYSPHCPAGEAEVYDTAAEAAGAFVRTVGGLAVLEYLNLTDEPDEDHRGEERAERERERAERGW